MKKIAAGITCVLLSVIIAVLSVGCGGGGELTYTGEYQTNPTEGRSSTDSSDTQSSAQTVLYQLTTEQGQTVQVLSTTGSTTEIPTMSYDPVTVPPMTTEYTSVNTTVYVPPTYTPDVSSTVTTGTTTTTERTTKEKDNEIKYKSVGGNADGGVDGNKIKVWVDNIFGKKIKAKSSSVMISYGTLECKANCKVSSELYAGEQVEIEIGIPTTVSKAVESSDEAMIYVTVPKGTIVSENGVSNKEFRVTIYASDI